MGLFQRRNHLLTYLKLRVFFPPNFAAKLWRTWRSAQRACLGAKILLHHLHSHLSLPSLTTQTTIYKLSKILRRGNKSSSSGSLHSPPCLPSYPLLSSPPTFYPQSRLLFLPCWQNLHHCPIEPHCRHFSVWYLQWALRFEIDVPTLLDVDVVVIDLLFFCIDMQFLLLRLHILWLALGEAKTKLLRKLVHTSLLLHLRREVTTNWWWGWD